MKSVFNQAQSISDEEVLRLVSENIPRWRKACDDSDADTVVLQQRAFGSSPNELFLMGIAIRYAGMMHKTVMIAP
jgi:hypothetical protein